MIKIWELTKRDKGAHVFVDVGGKRIKGRLIGWNSEIKGVDVVVSCWGGLWDRRLCIAPESVSFDAEANRYLTTGEVMLSHDAVNALERILEREMGER